MSATDATDATPAPARRRPSPAARRFGYAVAVAVNVGCWWLLHVWPGWQAVPFLTEEFTQVLGVVDLSLAAGALANLAFLAYDAPWFRALTQAGLDAISFVVVSRLLVVFPFDVRTDTHDWTPWVRALLLLGLVGTALAAVAELVRFVRAVMRPS